MRVEAFKREVLNVPNGITIGRVLLIPPILMLIHPTDPARGFWAAMLFAAVSTLDLLDGWLARRQGLVTVFGKFVDPLADKVTVFAMLVYLVGVGTVAPWIVAALLTREFYIAGIRQLAGSEGIVIAAGGGGKMKTAFQVVGIACVAVRYPYEIIGLGFTVDFLQFGTWSLWGSVVLSLTSAVQYTLAFRDGLRNAGPRADDGEREEGT